MKLDEFYFEEYSNATAKFTLRSNKILSDKALFLDRDGVLIEDVHHINNPEKVKLCPNVINFLRKAREENYDLIIITNQSSLSRSIINYEEYKNITSKFLSYLPSKIYPDLILSSFHMPNNVNNLDDYHWRKPGTGMIDYALKKRKYNKLNSFIIGDKLTDLVAGYESGLAKILYIQSKLHKNQSDLVKKWSSKNNIHYEQLLKLDPQILSKEW